MLVDICIGFGVIASILNHDCDVAPKEHALLLHGYNVIWISKPGADKLDVRRVFLYCLKTSTMSHHV